MHAIILAAGRGSRLKHLTDEVPKSMTPVAGKPLLVRQIEAYRANDVTQIAVVRGYLAERIALDDVSYYDNADWETTGLLPSLFTAQAAMPGGFFISYGDTTFHPSHVAALITALDAGHAMAGIVDTDWEAAYEGRDWHPPSEAENARVDADGNITDVGKRVPGPGSLGEYTGLCAVSAEAAPLWIAAWEELLGRYGLDGGPWGQKGSVRMAYVADMMQHLIGQGHAIKAVEVQGGWREVDTPEDLERASAIVDW